MFGSALLCQRCANLSACNLKIEVTVRISMRFIRGKASAFSVLSTSSGKRYCSYYCVCFVCNPTPLARKDHRPTGN